MLDLQRNLKQKSNIINEIDIIQQNLDLISYTTSSILEDEKITDNLDLVEEMHSLLTETKLKLKILETSLMFKNKEDVYNTYIDIHSGSGGTEAQDWVEMLLRMYTKWIESHKFKHEIIEITDGDVAGLKSVTIRVSGDHAYGWLRTESGIHRLVRKSPFDSGNRRHTSFASVFVYPDVDDEIDIEINPSDLRIDVYRASGAGGQHVNTTESAVRITHLPTKIVTQCQNDRSQHKNKENAMKQLHAKLYLYEQDKMNEIKNKVESEKSDISWGNQIRSYILDDSRIKDLRTKYETSNVQDVLDGNLDQFIEECLRKGY